MKIQIFVFQNLLELKEFKSAVGDFKNKKVISWRVFLYYQLTKTIHNMAPGHFLGKEQISKELCTYQSNLLLPSDPSGLAQKKKKFN